MNAGGAAGMVPAPAAGGAVTANAGASAVTASGAAAGTAVAAAGTAGVAPVGASAAGSAGAPEQAGACTPFVGVSPRLWRLSADQYSNAVKDLLGLAAGPELTNLGGASEFAFLDDDTLTVNADFAFAVYQATQDVLEQIAPNISQLASCQAGEAEDACAQRFIATYGERAYRRTLDPSEIERLSGAYTQGALQDFDTGIRLVLEALLQSPFFLNRTELGATPTAADSVLTPHETAAQLSFFLSGSAPDPELLAAADDGRLATDAGIVEQVDRLLSLPNTHDNVTQIVLGWFNVPVLFSKSKNPEYFSALSAADQDQQLLMSDLFSSSRLFVDNLLWNGSGALSELLTSRTVFVNQRLATLYGFPFSGTADEFLPVEAPAIEPRAGILTQPAVVWGASNSDVTSIVHRGLFVHNDVLCVPQVSPPPDGVLTPEVIAYLGTLPTERARAEYRAGDLLCGSCHAHIDPFGLVLEDFDPIGRYRTEENGQPVSSVATFNDPPLTGEIMGPTGLASSAITGGAFAHCGSEKIASYALGRKLQANSCATADVEARFTATDGSVQSLFREVARSSFMRQRTGGAP